MGRFINADVFTSTGQGILGNNMFAYCGNNPVNRDDPSGQLWGVIVIGTLANVVASAVSSWMTGETFTAGDAVGAAIEGFMATSMTVLHIPPIIANPVATFCGGVIGKYIDGDTSKDAFEEIMTDTAKSGLTTAAFWGAGKLVSKYADIYLSGKYVKLNAVDEIVKDLAYKPLHLNESSIKTVISDNIWDSVKSVAVDFIFK